MIFHFKSQDGRRGKIVADKSPDDLIRWMWNMIQIGLPYRYVGCTESHLDSPQIVPDDPIVVFQDSWWDWLEWNGELYHRDEDVECDTCHVGIKAGDIESHYSSCDVFLVCHSCLEEFDDEDEYLGHIGVCGVDE